jgi:hypothetical protein
MNVESYCRGETIIRKGEALPAGFVEGDVPRGKARDEACARAAVEAQNFEPGTVRHRLYSLEAALGGTPEMDFPLQHVFAPGVYARTIHIPKGGVIIGKIHKHKHLNILSQGTVLVLTESQGIERLTGPLTMVSEPGTKRAVVAESDTVWTTIHLTNETDLAKIEDEVIAKSFAEYEQFLKIGAPS